MIYTADIAPIPREISQGFAKVFSADAKKDGMRVVDRDYTSDHATDFTAILTKIKADHRH